ncbi:PREDICTED: pre-rRNA-processing protein TSR2 homolog [Populus euphratica]|uniref:Pre-rRNA-processing protein TSR2 homolog n=1 Tax=Populus euphratica TaxID=75702 RepID=A0AAJ6UNJ0_POPEU|nr:PREDICTED: pre-rRNA-processing protein TSR2 homolog [Populus euphratica]
MESSSSSITGGFGQIGSSKQLTADSISQFREGICLILSKWSALQLAVENEWGGRGSGLLAEQLASDILSWFTQSKEPLFIEDLKGILDEAMLSLNPMIEDGSIEGVAEKLMIMHEECLEGNYSSIQKLREAAPRTRAHQHVKQAVDSDDDSEDSGNDDKMGDDESNMMVDAPEFQQKMYPVDKPVNVPRAKEAQSEDGWTVVSSRRNKDRRN